jgi:hypothetical protein
MNTNNDHVATGTRLGVGRSTVFGLWASGQLGSIKIGRKRFSTDRQIDDYLTRLEQAASGPGDAA